MVVRPSELGLWCIALFFCLNVQTSTILVFHRDRGSGSPTFVFSAGIGDPNLSFLAWGPGTQPLFSAWGYPNLCIQRGRRRPQSLFSVTHSSRALPPPRHQTGFAQVLFPFFLWGGEILRTSQPSSTLWTLTQWNCPVFVWFSCSADIL